MSLFKSLFGWLGGGSGDSGGPAPGEAVEYKDYRIRPAPCEVGGQYQVAGVIEKDFEDGPKVHQFIRADVMPGREDAESFTVMKARQIIDQQGDRMFAEE